MGTRLSPGRLSFYGQCLDRLQDFLGAVEAAGILEDPDDRFDRLRYLHMRVSRLLRRPDKAPTRERGE